MAISAASCQRPRRNRLAGSGRYGAAASATAVIELDLTPTVDALHTPDIDESLDEEGAKQRFWRSFKTLSEWYEDLPPP